MKPSLKTFAVAAVLTLLKAPLLAGEGAFIEQLERGRRAVMAQAEVHKRQAEGRKRQAEAHGSLSAAGANSALPEGLELRGQATVAGSGQVYPHASQPYWFYGTVAVRGPVRLTGKDGIYGAGELSGDIYVSGSGHRAAGPAMGQGQVSGVVKLFTKEGKPLGQFRVDRLVEVFGAADGDKADVSGVVRFGPAAR